MQTNNAKQTVLLSHLMSTMRTTARPKKTREEVCAQPPLPGMCRAAHEKWAFRAADNRCQTFIYGGCRGNDNRFDSEDECMQFCDSQQDFERLLKDFE